MKKILALVLVLALCLTAVSVMAEGNKVKIGFIFLHDENSTYDLNFINGAKEACEKLGVEYVLKTNIGESEACYSTAADLADEGCNIVFADSFGHEDYMIQAAKEYPNVQFCHATGTKAHTEGLDNYHNAFAAIYEGRYSIIISLNILAWAWVLSGLVYPNTMVLTMITYMPSPFMPT